MSDEKDYYLVFSDSDSYFFSRWFKCGYRHVHAIYHCQGNWSIVDPSLDALNVIYLEKAKNLDFISVYQKLNPEYTILRVAVKPNLDMPVWRIGPISCVSTIQYLLGIYRPLTVTPWGLYCYLVNKTPTHIRIVQNGFKQS